MHSFKLLFTLIISLIISIGFVYADSLTLSPFSFTYHGHAHGDVKNGMNHALGNGTTTAHFGLNAAYKSKYMVYTAWVFNDSFLKPAGGILVGPKYDFNDYFGLGLVGGVYVRAANGLEKFPWHYTTNGMEIIPMAAPVITGAIPITKSVGAEMNCAVTYIVNNCQFGVKVKF